MLNLSLEPNTLSVHPKYFIMKKLNFQYAFFYLLLLLVWSCSNGESDPIGSFPGSGNSGSSDGAWLIPSGQVFNGGPGKDGIPSIDAPQFSLPAQIDALGFLNDQDLVLGVKVGNTIRAYPHPILDWHEIVNDEVGGLPLAITYCPLTGTGIGWERTLDNTVTTFGVSGLLYNTNLMPYDRATESVWSQMLLTSVNGPNIRNEIITYPLIETTWKHWKELFPDSEVLDIRTGFNRTYGQYPYGDYKTNHSLLLFPIENQDGRLSAKARGLGVEIDGQSRFYRFQHFASGNVVTHNDNLNGKDIVVTGSSQRNFLVVYDSEIEPEVVLSFEAVEDEGPIIMKDQDGNRWTIFGEAVEGPYAGQTLKPVSSYIGMWFAWAAFHPEIEIFEP